MDAARLFLRRIEEATRRLGLELAPPALPEAVHG